MTFGPGNPSVESNDILRTIRGDDARLLIAVVAAIRDWLRDDHAIAGGTPSAGILPLRG